MDWFSPLHWAHVQAQSVHMGNSPQVHSIPDQANSQMSQEPVSPQTKVSEERISLDCGHGNSENSAAEGGIVCVCVRCACPEVDGCGLEGCSSQRKKGSLHGPVSPPQGMSPETCILSASVMTLIHTAGAHARATWHPFTISVCYPHRPRLLCALAPKWSQV